ncbi:hypothetical protein [Eisenbergiella sp.]
MMNGEIGELIKWIEIPLKRKWPNWKICLQAYMEVVEIEKIKCERCGQTLLLAEYVKGEIKCPRCKKINKLDVKRTEPRAAPKE